jgi:asparagine synthase (glutamine-hydrolysing)
MAVDSERATLQLALMPGSALGSQTYFKGIGRVEAAGLVTFTRSGQRIESYWQPRRETLRLNSSDEYAEALRSLLDTAVKAQLRGAGSHVGAQLSAGMDSSAVTATAARILGPAGGKVTAFTSVPRAGYSGSAPRGRLGDEGPLAAETAALYPNIDHVIVRGRGASPLSYLDQDFFWTEEPLVNLCSGVWIRAINEAARRRGLAILLEALWGNLTISTSGLDWLPELIARRRFRRWFREVRALVRGTPMRWRGALAMSFSPWTPESLWRLANWTVGRGGDLRSYSAINPKAFARLKVKARARAAGKDLAKRDATDSYATRLRIFRDADSGNYLKGTLGEFGIDLRDPTSDRRLVEFSLSVPMCQFVREGQERALARRAFADRLPATVLNESRRGYQAVDWHEGLTAHRGEVAAEIERTAANETAATALDITRLRNSVCRWPAGGWETEEVADEYRVALLRGISIGHFLRRASGGNQ